MDAACKPISLHLRYMYSEAYMRYRSIPTGDGYRYRVPETLTEPHPPPARALIFNTLRSASGTRGTRSVACHSRLLQWAIELVLCTAGYHGVAKVGAWTVYSSGGNELIRQFDFPSFSNNASLYLTGATFASSPYPRDVTTPSPGPYPSSWLRVVGKLTLSGIAKMPVSWAQIPSYDRGHDVARFSPNPYPREDLSMEHLSSGFEELSDSSVALRDSVTSGSGQVRLFFFKRSNRPPALVHVRCPQSDPLGWLQPFCLKAQATARCSAPGRTMNQRWWCKDVRNAKTLGAWIELPLKLCSFWGGAGHRSVSPIG
ncbi:hypothetical protein BJV78DRAFT_1154778 [Lactifluus subvellereus]|nr:hypothetical protein BJV78DRAFT_1154778 [Lactifluus subvellereus]